MTCKNCGPNISAGPKPFYEEVKESVVENHETIIERHRHAVGVRVLDAWNVPGETLGVTVRLEDVAVLPVGAFLFNPQYGYFLISQWNPNSQQVGIVHVPISGTASTGTFVPAMTPFLIVPKPCCADDQSEIFPFLDADFTAPFTNNNVTVEVTSTFGLRVGEYVRIGTGLYRLDEIKSSKQIVIFNQGAGFTGGATVLARNLQGDRQYLITAEVAYVCSVGVTSTTGKLIICDGADQKVITGASVGQVPVLIDPVTGTVQFLNLGDATITDGSISTAKLADHSVTSIKIANAAVGDAQLENSSINNSKIAANSIATNQIIDLAVSTAKIADASVTTAKLAAGAADTAHVADNAITTPKILDSAVTGAKIANSAVDNAQLADGAISQNKLQYVSVGTTELQTGAVTAAILATAAVTTGKIADGNIINAKIANATIDGHAKIAVGTITGHNILDTSISELKLGGLPDGGADAALPFDHADNSNVNTGSSVNTCKTWIYGPWVIARFAFTIVFAGAETNAYFVMPVAPYTAEGAQLWMGFTNITSASASAKDSLVEPITGTTALIRLKVLPGPTSAAHFVTGVAWCIYPWRSPDLGAEA